MSIEDYEPVQSRFSRFIEWAETREQFFSVISQLLSLPGDDICVMKTTILCDGVVVATGHAEEIRNQGNVNKTSSLENCETSSLGRCLSNFPMHNFCGTSLDKRPSREEMSKVQRMTTRDTDGGSITEPSNLASEKQLNMIRAVCKSMGRTVPASLQSMTKRDASAYIDTLKSAPAAAQNEEPEEAF
jgi:hypothetical protein